jgi:hypothetical protein
MREPSSVNSRAVENDVLLRYTFVNELALVNTLTVCIRITLLCTITLKPSDYFVHHHAYIMATEIILCVLHLSRNKEGIFLYAA